MNRMGMAGISIYIFIYSTTSDQPSVRWLERSCEVEPRYRVIVLPWDGLESSVEISRIGEVEIFGPIEKSDNEAEGIEAVENDVE